MDALIVLASLSHSTSRKISEEGLALAAGLALEVIAIRWGVSPYRYR